MKRLFIFLLPLIQSVYCVQPEIRYITSPSKSQHIAFAYQDRSTVIGKNKFMMFINMLQEKLDEIELIMLKKRIMLRSMCNIIYKIQKSIENDSANLINNLNTLYLVNDDQDDDQFDQDYF
jgi:hypothetical protein